MFEALFLSVHGWVGRHRRMVAGALLLAAGLSLARLPHIAFDSNAERMLPATPEVRRSLRFLRESGLSDNVVLSVSLQDSQADSDRLIVAVDRLVEDLRRGEWVREVDTGLGRTDVLAGVVEFLGYAPQLLDPARMEKLERELDADRIEQKVRATYRRLLTTSGMGALLMADPLGIAQPLLQDLQGWATSFGYEGVTMVQGRWFSADERQALLLLRTSVPATDGFGARALLEHIEACVARSPIPLETLTVAAHRHTVSNENVIRRDVMRIFFAASLGFLALALLCFRDGRAAALLGLPVLAILLSIALSSLLLAELSYFIVGMSAVLVGIAIDYAIHVYVAQRTGGAPAVAAVAKPVAAGAVTTISVFFAFFFSTVPGYAQLAIFSIAGLVICLWLSIFFLPHLVQARSGRRLQWSPRFPAARSRAGRLLLAGLWAVALGLLALSATTLDFESDMAQFDGSEKAVREDEVRFRRIWGGRAEPGMLVVEGDALEPVLRQNDRIARRARARIGPESLTSLSALWPSQQTRARRLARWRQFWEAQGPRIAAELAAAGARQGFAPDAFQPFLDWAEHGPAEPGLPDTPLLNRIQERFLQTDGDTVRAISYFEDTESRVRQLADLATEESPSVYLVSRRALGGAISEAIWHESVRLALLAAALILATLFALMRNLRLALLALAPMVTGLAAMLGLPPLLGLPLNAASIIAAMIVVGLCLDYGIFMVYSEQRRARHGTPLSVTLSALTTLVGASALLAAAHPVMFSIGATLVCGVTAGYLCAAGIVPALFALTEPRIRAGSKGKKGA